MMSACARAYSDHLKQMHDRRAKICEPCEFKSRDECLGWYWPDTNCPKELEIWAEKPETESFNVEVFGEIEDFEGYPKKEMDAFHEKLKAHIEWLNDYINARQLIVNQFAFHDEKYWWKGMDLNEMQEGAENWKKFCSWTLDECIEALNAVDKLSAMQGFKNDAESMCKKLRAIEAWYESEKGYNFPGFEELGKLLEGS